MAALRILTRRGVGLVAAVAVLWSTGRLLGIDALWIAAVATLAVVVAGVLLVTFTATRVTVGRRVSPMRLFNGTAARVDLTVRNIGRLPTSVLAIRDLAPQALTPSAGFVVAPMRPGGVVRLQHQLVGRRRGVYEVGPVQVRVRDPFGVAARSLTVGGTDQLIVYPPVHRLAPGLPLGGLTGGSGASHPRPGIDGDEVATVREYVQGDDLRKVHWGSTAHRGQLMVRQDETPQRPDSTIVLDLRADAHRGVRDVSSLETAASAAASVAYHLAEHGVDSSLLTRPVQHRARSLPWHATLERIARMQADADVDLAGLWRQLATGVGGSGLLVAVVCVPDAALLRSMVRAGRGASVKVALLVDADAHVAGARRGPEPTTTASALAAAGWRVAVLGPDEDIGRRWRELLAGTSGHRTGART